jgi:hypothetical protein
VKGRQHGDPSQELTKLPLVSASNTLRMQGTSAEVRYSKSSEAFSICRPVSSSNSRRIACSAVSHGQARPPGNDSPRPSLRSMTRTSGPFLTTATEARRKPKTGTREYTASPVRDKTAKSLRLIFSKRVANSGRGLQESFASWFCAALIDPTHRPRRKHCLSASRRGRLSKRCNSPRLTESDCRRSQLFPSCTERWSSQTRPVFPGYW